MADIIEANSVNDISNRGATNETLAKFKGKPRQTVINVDDGYRLVVMDGETLGGKFKTASVDEVAAAKTEILNQTLTQEKADQLYLGKSEKPAVAEKATTADTATKATQDGDGKVISETYATKTELTTQLADKVNKADIPDVSNLATKTEVTNGLAAKADKTSVTAELAKKANVSHTHTISNVTGLQDALDAKATTEALTTGLEGKLDKSDPSIPKIGIYKSSNAEGINISRLVYDFTSASGVTQGDLHFVDAESKDTFVSIPNPTKLVPISGDRGKTAGYESWGNLSTDASQTLSMDSPDNMLYIPKAGTTAITFTFDGTGASNVVSTKVIWINGQNLSSVPTITFKYTNVTHSNTTFGWFGGTAPTFKKNIALVGYFHDGSVDLSLLGTWD